MPEFLYEAKNGPKDVVKGSLLAASRAEAVRMIEEKGYYPVSVEISKSAPKPSATPGEDSPRGQSSRTVLEAGRGRFSFKRGVSVYEVCVFTRQLAGFMRAKVPLMDSLDNIRRQLSERSKLRPVLDEIAAKVRGGGRLSEALAQSGVHAFDARYVSLVEAGESGGSLDKILEQLADYLETEEELRGQLRSALAYPALIVCVGTATLFFLFTFCIPKLTTLFKSSFNTLPLPTKVLLSLSQPAWQVFFFALLFALAGVVAFFVFGGEKNRKILDRLLNRLPVLGAVRIKADIARFSSTLSMLLKNGVPVYRAVEIARPVLLSETLKEELAGAQSAIIGGEMLTAVIRRSAHFPPFATQMIGVGEDGGRLEESLDELSRFYARESLRGIKTVTSLIEPIFILALSLAVGFVVAGIMLPIFDMNWIK
jgi:type II secretory pathway component PulF